VSLNCDLVNGWLTSAESHSATLMESTVDVSWISQ